MADPHSPKALRASMGALFSEPVASGALNATAPNPEQRSENAGEFLRALDPPQPPGKSPSFRGDNSPVIHLGDDGMLKRVAAITIDGRTTTDTELFSDLKLNPMIKDKTFARFPSGFATDKAAHYEDALREGIACCNPNCITLDPLEHSTARSKFTLVPAPTSSRAVLRCHYCETDIDHFVIAHRGERWFKAAGPDVATMTTKDLRAHLFFADAEAAKAKGYAPAA